MNAYHIAPPGQKPAGAARWGHMDMAGNVLEWMADITGPGRGIVRGGSWEGHNDEIRAGHANYPLGRTYGSLGFRCAYGQAPPPPPKLDPKVPVFRAYNAKKGDYLMGIDRDAIGKNYVDEGRQFLVFDVPPVAAKNLVRCEKDGFNFLSNDLTCGGAKSKGLIGYTSRKKFEGNAVELLRCRDPKGKTRLATTKPTECEKRGFVLEGSLGWVGRAK